MSFTSAHNDYLDPDRHLWQDEDYGFEAIQKALKERDTGRWVYKLIDCCWTGKDADLEAHGYQGLQLDNVTEEHAYAIVRAGKTVVGDDVCLNLPEDAPDELYEKAREAYLEQMTEVVCGCGFEGYWSGDDWFLSTDHRISVEVRFTAEGEINPAATADALIQKGEESLKNWETEMEYVDRAGSELSGWKDAKGRHMKEGKVPSCAAWKNH